MRMSAAAAAEPFLVNRSHKSACRRHTGAGEGRVASQAEVDLMCRVEMVSVRECVERTVQQIKKN
jgi:hypothetical protein